MANATPNIKQIISEEYKKCAKDPVYFFKKYVYIQHPQLGRIKFNLYPFQEKVLSELFLHNYSIILKSRQLGISTLTAAIALHMMIFNRDKNILVIATKQTVAKEMVSKVRYAYDNLPSWLREGYVENNKLNLKLKNGSQIVAESSAGDAGRSKAVSMLVIDEAAFVQDIEEIWGSAQQTLATGGRSIVLSTPNGVANWFHREWTRAKEGKNKFNTIQLHWSMHPDRNQAWRDEQDIILGPRLAAQECDADFLASGNTVVDPDTLKFYKETFIRQPIEQRGPNKELWIWELPNYLKSYIVSCDVGRGDGADFSTAHVIDVESMSQVAEFKAQLSTKDFGNFLVGLATEYNDALLVIENATHGWAVLQQVIDRHYNNLYYTEQRLNYVDEKRQYTNKIGHLEKKSVAGFTTSPTVRPLMINKLEDYFRTRNFMLYSDRTMNELYAFIYNGAKAEAMKGYNDDLVIALAIGMWVRDTALQLNKLKLQTTKENLNAFIVSRQETEIYTGDFAPAHDQWNIPTGNPGEEEDISKWLL